jgi:hypothetical protein
LSFTVNGEDWTFDGTNITHAFTDGTESLLAPVIGLSPGATVSPESGAEQDFFTYEGVTYTVTAEDGTTQYYTVRATSGWYNRTDWLVLPRHGYHDWNIPDGIGSQSLWYGGRPMLAIDDDLESGWHSFAYDYVPLPQMLIIDMRKSRRVSQVIGEGLYCNNIELYVTDDPAIPGYAPYTINWGEDEDAYWRGAHYDEWANPLIPQIPETPPAEWGSPTQVSVSEEAYPRIDGVTFYRFSCDLQDAKGQFLILVFNGSSADPHIAVFNVAVNSN